MLYFPPCISIPMQISIYSSQQAGELQSWGLWHEMRVGLQNQPSGAQGQEAPRRVKPVMSSHWLTVETSSTEALSAIWDTLGNLRIADVTQQQHLDAKHDVLVHLKKPSLGNQN